MSECKYHKLERTMQLGYNKGRIEQKWLCPHCKHYEWRKVEEL